MNRTALFPTTALAIALGLGGTPAHGQRVEHGALAAGDQQLDDGKYFDVVTFQGEPGQQVVITLSSQEFDTFLVLLSPSGKDTQNDDYNGDQHQSRIETTLDEAGEWRIAVTSYQSGATGSYELVVDLGNAGPLAGPPASGKPPRRAAPPTPPSPSGMGGGPQVYRGELAQGDQTLDSGEFIDIYPFQGVPGGRVRLTLRSDAFDTYLVVRSPSGEQSDNDDASEGNTRESALEMTTTAGEYTVVVTSYQAGESGPYELTIDQGGGGAVPPPRVAKPPAGGAGPAMGNSPRIERGRLEQGDQTLSGGEYIDSYEFDGRRGQRVVIELVSQDFDTYVLLRGPGSQQADNDDATEGDTHRSRIEATLEEDGTFTVGVTSYQTGEQGAYELRIHVTG